jgi:hypothetical protein
VLILPVTILVCTGYLETGFSGKTLWDWLEVVGIPVIVVIVAGVFASVTQKAERRAEEQRERDTDHAREAILRAYLDDMTKLILEHELQDSKEGSTERAVAYAHTFMALDNLDGLRKGVLLQFLKKSQLINKDKPVISLDFANLTNASLSSADLCDTDLHGVNLTYADLRYANLRNSNLTKAVLSNTDLRNSNLTKAVLSNTNLYNSDLREAVVTREQLDSASDLSNVLLPREIEMPSSA